MAGPVFKGSTGELQPGRYKWRRGLGWDGIRVFSGREAEIWGEVGNMQFYCEEIDVELETQYGKVVGKFAGLIDGGDDATSRGETIWEVQYNESEIPLLEAAYARDLEALKVGSVQTIQKAHDDWQKKSVEETLNTDKTATVYPTVLDAFFTGVLNGRAKNIWDELVGGRTHVRFFQPVLTLSASVGPLYATPKSIPGRPVVYSNTTAMINAAQVPPAMWASLPAGKWLEHPPQVRLIVGQRKEISQKWEWFESISSIHYPQ